MPRGPTRRAALSLGGLGALALGGAAAAHTPYRQWVVYRRAHLLIGCHRDDAAAHALATAAAAHLEAHLPSARPRVARAPSAMRLAALLATDQLDLAVLTPAEVEAMTAAGRLSLTTLLPLGADHALMAHARFPDDHAALVAGALADAPVAGGPARPDAASPAPRHPGAVEGPEGRAPSTGGG